MALPARLSIAALVLLALVPVSHAEQRPTIDASLLERPPVLQPAISFWRHVFGKYSQHQVVLHARDYPNKIFTVLDYRDEAARGMDAAALAALRRRETEQTIERIDALLGEIAAANGRHAGLSDDAKAIVELLADLDDPDIYRKVQGRVRAQQGVQERTREGLERAGRYLPYMESVFAERDLPPVLTRLPLVESSFDTRAYSKVGAAGVWQFIPSSARRYMRLDYMLDDRRDPWNSTRAAAAHLSDDYALLQDWPLAITAYNFGRAGVKRALEAVDGDSLGDLIRDYEHPRFGFASRNFYASFVAAVDVEQARERWFDIPLRPAEPARFDEVETQHYVAWSTLQRLSGWDPEHFRIHNPAYGELVREGQLLVPPNHRIRVAPGHGEAFARAYLALNDGELHARQRDAFITHRIRSGETLSEIARRHGTSASRLQQLNGLRSAHHVRIGQSLRIPAPSNRNTTSVARTTPAAERPHHHQVGSGETLSQIAARYGITTTELAALNGIRDPRRLRAGQRLRLPASGPGERASARLTEYRVSDGETLSQIALRHDTSTNALRALNGIDDADQLQVGQRLRVPGTGTNHVVAPGETLSGIADRYGQSLQALLAANPLQDPHALRPGQTLTIPGQDGPQRHRVSPGETLWDIARRHDLPLARIVAHNALEDADSIRPGQLLEIPN
ncbi:LysM peptidoglycan-binding domain-containing protein [Algiphilus sp.]|uniref:LysM peptidoglycan-binding domain-containing protein n=1 Tax=Algiphilus sp. TaxID=1872431 RepID=UPI003B521612